MIYGYVRVSTDRQTVENQRYEISMFCKNEKITIDGWIEETTSGTKSYDKRKLGKLMMDVGKDDVIICTELSRLGRSLFMIMRILGHCMDVQCQVWTVKERYRLGNDLQSKVLAFCFSLIADVERELISQRTKEALSRLKAEGRQLGHKPGQRCRLNPICQEHHVWIEQQLKENYPKRRIARDLGISPGTLYRYLEYISLEKNCCSNETSV